ncbi:MAG: MBL fold metallo-hydrolase [Firmicutes bacterium]|nr:MBL fold metallo-hydrolase [Bacillota bacterium]MCL5040030.1 MBL fold metallo-hydrolase [Bacillota bacterium]
MRGRIVSLVDNVVERGRGLAEHGLAYLLELDAEQYLLDTGQSGTVLLHNAELMGVDWNRLTGIILSHGHYDHTGGLRPLLVRLRRRVPVYAHPDIFRPHFAREKDGRLRPIGLPFNRRELESLGARFIPVETFSEIRPGLWLTGPVPRRTSFEVGDERLVVWTGGGSRSAGLSGTTEGRTPLPESGSTTVSPGPAGLSETKEGRAPLLESDSTTVSPVPSSLAGTAEGWAPDPLADDLSVVIQTGAGTILIQGCAHAGTINILQHVEAHLGRQHFSAIMGGSHLGAVPVSQLEAAVTALRGFDSDQLLLSHCTGLKGAFRLREEFGQRYQPFSVGEVLEF